METTYKTVFFLCCIVSCCGFENECLDQFAKLPQPSFFRTQHFDRKTVALSLLSCYTNILKPHWKLNSSCCCGRESLTVCLQGLNDLTYSMYTTLLEYVDDALCEEIEYRQHLHALKTLEKAHRLYEEISRKQRRTYTEETFLQQNMRTMSTTLQSKTKQLLEYFGPLQQLTARLQHLADSTVTRDWSERMMRWCNGTTVAWLAQTASILIYTLGWVSLFVTTQFRSLPKRLQRVCCVCFISHQLYLLLSIVYIRSLVGAVR